MNKFLAFFLIFAVSFVLRNDRSETGRNTSNSTGKRP